MARAVFLILTKGLPKLREESKWSETMRNFLGRCLTKDPEKRPYPEDLQKVLLFANPPSLASFFRVDLASSIRS
jgi:serine/threonine protein kinase